MSAPAQNLIWRCHREAWWRRDPERWEAWRREGELPLFWRTDWLETVLRHFKTTPEVWVAYHAGEPVGALPLAPARWRGLPVRTWLGAGVLCPDHLDVLVPKDMAAGLWASFLQEGLPRMSFLLLQLDGVRADSALAENLPLTTLAAAHSSLSADATGKAAMVPTIRCRQGKASLWRRRPVVCPYLPIPPEGGQGVLSRVSKKLADELRYLQRRVQRDAPGVRLRPLWQEAEQRAALERLEVWSRDKHGSASAWNDLRFVAFHRDWIAQMTRAGVAALYVLAPEEGDAWALAYVLPDGATLRYYQPGLDRRFARYSPGKWLIFSLLEAAPAHGWRVFDFMRGNEAYKFEWQPQVAEDGEWWLARGIFGRMVLNLAQRWAHRHERA